VAGATRVKICGITNRDDAERAVEGGAWALGLIFFKASPRSCKQSVAGAIARAHHRDAEICGVFVNPKLDDLARAADATGLTMLQLHGEEGPAFCAEAARRTGCKIIKAVQVAGRADIDHLIPFHTDFHMLDTRTGDRRRGGTGETFDWRLAREHRGPAPLILSGGLDPANVADGIAAVAPFAVDVASGTEARPGIKDPAKLEAFFAAVRSTETVEAAPEHEEVA
jgi:phosphoribosylanthranilate isomerase